MYGVKRPNVFDNIMSKVQGQQHAEEDIAAKLEAACAKMKQKAAGRERRWIRGNANWTSTVLTSNAMPAITQSSLCSD